MSSTKTPWQQGGLLMTKEVQRCHPEDQERMREREARLVCTEFNEFGGGCRKLIAECQRPEDAEHIVKCVNAHDALLDALENLLSGLASVPSGHTGMMDLLVTGVDVQAGLDAIAKAKGGAA